FVKGIKGWVRENDIDILKKTVFEVLPESHLIFEDPEEGENVPILLENNKFIEPFEIVTDLYGRPTYKNIDPTGPLSLFFAFSFGFCLTDAGYGLLLVIISLILTKKFRFLPNFVKFLRLLFLCGISTIIIGSLTGGWFGDTLYKLPDIFIIKFLKNFVLLNPLEGGNKAMLFLLIAIIFGYIQIIWGLILNLYIYLKRFPLKYCGEAITLLLIQILVPFITIGYLKTKIFLKGPFFVLILCFLYLMSEKAKTQKEIMLKGFWAIYGVYSVIAGNLLGDVLSYSRLFGLGLTTSILGLVVNQMVLMVKNIPYVGIFISFFVFIIGHFGNLMINLLGSYVHTSRLQYLEFFTKFFEGGGRFFKPFKEVRFYTLKKLN
ncbi:MAG: V-type ATPase 116kDa subunit family protein, partial [Candidatus Ratteibacteria bacterium]